MTTLKLGKQPAAPRSTDLKLRDYVDASALPPIPTQWGYEGYYTQAGWQMLGNDQYGDCVWAGAAHETMLMRKAAGSSVTFTDKAVLSDYAACTGFNPADPSTDQGTDVHTALAYRQKIGIRDAAGARHKIGAYLSIDPTNLVEVYHAAYLLEAVGLGIQFPTSAMDQFNQGQMWTVVQGSPIEGGHYVPLVAKRHHLEVVTWGQTQLMSVAFLQTYADEAWAYVSTDMLDPNAVSPRGLDLQQLQADLAAL